MFDTSDIPTSPAPLLTTMSFCFSSVVDVIQARFQVVLEGVMLPHFLWRAQVRALIKPEMHLEVGQVRTTELGPSFRP